MRSLLLLLAATCLGCRPAAAPPEELLEGTDRRMPAEWEPQAAVWLQWPRAWEGAAVRDAFAAIVTTIADYEDVHVLAHDLATESAGREAVGERPNVAWHTVRTDSSWMRDNGPRYVVVDGRLAVQNWGFDAWGGGFGDVPYDFDNGVPGAVSDITGLPMEAVGLVHERGDLEVNGVDTALVNWSVIGHRNPGRPRWQITNALKRALGVDSVLYAQGFDPDDGTRGHVDGMARFVAADTLLVGDDGSALLDDVAEQLAEQRPDLTIERLQSVDAVRYLNFLVGNGFVLSATGADDDVARAAFERFFPGREVRFVDTAALWSNGGGVHCVTNDQPAI